MRSAMLWVLAGVVGACSDPSSTKPTVREEAEAALAGVLATGPQTYVLGAIEEQHSEPLLLFDHVCDGVRRQQSTRDSLRLAADGTARRASVSVTTEGDSVVSSYYRVETGVWSYYRGQGVYYYADGPSIAVGLTPQNVAGSAMTRYWRIQSADVLKSRLALGGWCIGVTPERFGDSRHAEFIYTRR